MFRLLWRIREYEIPSHILKTLQFSLYAATGYSGVSFLDSSVGEIVSVKGASMSPTLSPEAKSSGKKDKVLVTRRATIDRGDVVVFTNPTNPDGHGIKRVIGLPGDTIMRDIRRIGIQEEKGYTGAKQLGMAKLGPVVIVPQGSVWVEGDNWRESQDSNYYGPISANLINGKAHTIVWPWNRRGAIDGLPHGKNKSRTVVIPGDPKKTDEWLV